MLTAAEIANYLSYQPDTGNLIWKIGCGRARAGAIAGGISPSGYVVASVRGNLYMAHRLAWVLATGEWPLGYIDHINGNKTDNRLVNLRDVSRSENSQNVHKPRKNNTTGYLGVKPEKDRFVASIKFEGRSLRIGSFKTAKAAHNAYLEAKRTYHPGYVQPSDVVTTEPFGYSESNADWRAACDAFRANSGRFALWLASAGTRSESAEWFGVEMTNTELINHALDSRNPQIEIAAAMKEIDRRYITDCSPEIAQHAHQLSAA